MARYVVLNLPAGSTLAEKQLVPFFAYTKADLCIALHGDSRVVRANGTRATLEIMLVQPYAMSATASQWESGVAIADWIAAQEGVKYLRFIASTGTGTAVEASLELDKASRDKYLFASDPSFGTVDQGKQLPTKSLTWNTEARWAHYWPLVERSYPALKGLRERAVRPNGLCAEAALVLSMLVMADELKAWRLVSARGSRVTALYNAVSGMPAHARANFLDPGSWLNHKLEAEGGTAALSAFTTATQAQLSTFAGTAYQTYFKGPEPLPQVRMGATGDGSETNGILGKPCEAVTLVSYVKDEQADDASLKYKTFSTTLKHSGRASPTVLHIFLTAMNYSDTRIRITVTVDATRKYHLLGSKSGASATLKPTDFTWNENVNVTTPVEVTPPGQARKTVQKWGDGTYYDPTDRDLVIPGGLFPDSAKTFTVHAKNVDLRGGSYDDETLMGFVVVPGDSVSILPPPVRMMGLFANDAHVPYKKDAPGADAERLKAAYKHVDKVADLCISAGTFTVKMTAGGIGKLEGGLVVSAVEGTDTLADLKALGESKWQELRSSFLIPTKRGNSVEIEIRSFTDPNYTPEDEAWTYNKALSDRRCWGILGLLASRIAAKGKKPKAKAVWQAGLAEYPTSEARDKYLATLGALKPATLG